MDEKIKSLSEESIQKFQKKQYTEAIAGFRACVAELEKSGDPLDLAEMKNNLCVALTYNGDPQAALEAAAGTDTIFANAGDQRREGMSLANQGTAYESLKQYDKAIEAYEKARDCLSACGEKKMLSITLRSLADLQLKTGKQYQAVASLQSAHQQNPDGKISDKFFSSTLKKLINKITGK
jgi:tetratricopeptide (TPR) repeat protein